MLAIVGAVLLLLGLVLGGAGAIRTVGSITSLGDAQERTGSSTQTLEEGGSVDVWSTDQGASCSVTGPDGGPVSSSSVGTQTVSSGDRELHRAFSIEADQAGTYTIDCTSPYVLGPGLSVGGIVTGAIGGAVCCLGTVLLLVGLALWAVRRNRGP